MSREINFKYIVSRGNVERALSTVIGISSVRAHKFATNNVVKVITENIGKMTLDTFKNRFAGLIDRLSSERTWHEFGIFSSLGGRNFLDKFYATFLSQDKENISVSYGTPKSVGAGYSLYPFKISYFSRSLLIKNTWIDEYMYFNHLPGGMHFSWWKEWVETSNITQPDDIENYIFVYNKIFNESVADTEKKHKKMQDANIALQERSRTGQGIMINRGRFEKIKRKAVLSAEVLNALKKKHWKFDIMASQRNAIEATMKDQSLNNKITKLATKTYKDSFYEFIRMQKNTNTNQGYTFIPI